MNPSYLPYDDIGITLGVIAIALAFIVLVWNAVKAISEWRKMVKQPTDDKFANHERRITEMEAWIKRADQKLDEDWAFQQDEALFNQLMLKSIKQLLQHEIDDNDKQGLINMEKEIDDFLLQRAQR